MREKGGFSIVRLVIQAQIAFVILTFTVSHFLVSATASEVDLARQAKNELEDAVAVRAFLQSVEKYEKILAQNTDPLIRKQLLARIGEILFDTAGAQFRLLHADANQNNKAQLQNSYSNTLQKITQIEETLLKEEPDSTETPRRLYIYSQVLKEQGRNRESIQSLKTLIDRYPSHQDSTNAHLSLHEQLSQAKDFSTAITYIKKLKIEATSPTYPVVLDSLAFDYYYLNDVVTGLDYLVRELRWYEKTKRNSGENPEIQKTIKNIAVFYGSLIEAKPNVYTVDTFFSYIQKLGAGPEIAKAMKLLGSFFRSRGRDQAYETLKNWVLKTPLRASDKVDFLSDAIEKESARQEYSLLSETCTRLIPTIEFLKKDESRYQELMSDLKKNINAAIGVLQKEYASATGEATRRQIRSGLSSLYSTLLLMGIKNENETGQIHYNLAELYFSNKEYEKALVHYQWVFEENRGSITDAEVLSRSHFKAIISRYELLLSKKEISTESKAKPLADAKSISLGDVFEKWSSWVKDYSTLVLGQKAKPETSDFYLYQMILTLYSKGHIKEAISEIEKFTENFPKSNYVIPLSSLMLDTYLAGEDWEEAKERAKKVQSLQGTFHPEFRAQLEGVSADCSAKIIERNYKQKDYKNVIYLTDLFLKEYPTSKRKSECANFAGNAALALNDKPLALKYLDLAKSEGSSSGTAATLSLTKGSIAEEQFNYSAALSEYRNYQNLKNTQTPAEAKTLQDKIAFLALVVGDRKPAGELTLQKKMQDLRTKRDLSLERRLALIEEVCREWQKEDPFTKYSLLSELSETIPYSLRVSVAEVKARSPLKLEKDKIDRRVKLIAQAEHTFEAVQTLPWMRIRVSSLNEWANLYSDLYRDFDQIKRPKGMSAGEKADFEKTISEVRQPFFNKALEIRGRAYQQAMDSGVETEVFAPIAVSLSKEDRRIKNEMGSSQNTTGNLSSILLRAMRLEFSSETAENPHQQWLKALMNAVQRRNWTEISLLVKEGQGNKKMALSSAQQALSRSISFAVAGAQAEAIAELKEKGSDLSSPARACFRLAEVLAFYGVRSRLKTSEALLSFASDSDSDLRAQLLDPTTAGQVLAALRWSGADISEKIRSEIEKAAGKARR